MILENVRGGSTVYTDAWAAYIGLDYSYNHLVIDHAFATSRARPHEQHRELLVVPQADARSTYIGACPFHFDAYLGEQVFRFNERRDNNGGQFVKALKGVDRRQLTYALLTDR